MSAKSLPGKYFHNATRVDSAIRGARINLRAFAHCDMRSGNDIAAAVNNKATARSKVVR